MLSILKPVSRLMDDSGKTYINYCKKKISHIEEHIHPRHKILDVGCGVIKNHRLCFDYLQNKGFNIRGIDKKALKTKKIDKGNVTALKHKANSFDVVICLDVVEHIKDYKKAINELERVAKKRVILITPVIKFNTVRRILNRVRSLFGIGILEGHHYEFFKNEIISSFKKKARAKVSYIPYPLPILSSFLHKRKILSSGVFVIDFIP